MSFKQVAFYVGCAVAWFVLLPLFLIGGGLTLVCYALFSELRESMAGSATRSAENANAREIARRMCLGL